MNVSTDATGTILFAMLTMVFLFSGEPDVHDHVLRWLDCLNECNAVDPWELDE